MSKKNDSTQENEIITPALVRAVLGELVEYDELTPVGDAARVHYDNAYMLAGSQAARRAVRRGASWQSVLQVFVDQADKKGTAASPGSDEHTASLLALKAFVAAAFGGGIELGSDIDDVGVVMDRIASIAGPDYASRVLAAVVRAAGWCVWADSPAYIEDGIGEELNEQRRAHEIEKALAEAAIQVFQVLQVYQVALDNMLAKLNALEAEPQKLAEVTAPKKRGRRAA